MSLPHALLSDRTGSLGTTGGLLAGLPPAAVYGYLLVRLIIAVLLIILAARAATPHPAHHPRPRLPHRRSQS